MAATEIVLTGFSSNKFAIECNKAGIVCIWIAQLSKHMPDPTGIIVDPATKCITGYTMDGTQVSPTYKKYVFDEDTAFFTVTKTQGKFEQKIVFTKNGLSKEVFQELKNLCEGCAYSVIVEDCNCNFINFGINYDGESWCPASEYLELDDDDSKIESGTKGGDDKARIEISLTGKSNCPGLFFDPALDASIIPV